MTRGLPMTRRALALALFVALGCDDGGSGGDDGGVMDAAADGGADAGEACVEVDGRGAGERFASVDDALTSGARCVRLLAGDFAPPSAPLEGELRIEGPAEGTATLSGRLGGCRDVAYPEGIRTLGPFRAATLLELAPGARVELRDLALRGCDVAAHAPDATLVAERVVVDDVRAGLVASGEAGRMEVRESELFPDTRVVGDVIDYPSAAVGAIQGATLEVVDSLVEGRFASSGAYAFEAGDVVAEGLDVSGGAFALFLDVPETSDVSVRGLRSVGLADPGPGGSSGSVLIGGGRVSVSDSVIEDVESIGLHLDYGRETSVERVTFRRVGVAAIAVLGADARLDEVVVEGVPAGGFGVSVADYTPPDEPALREGRAEILDLELSGAGTHLIADVGGELVAEAGARLVSIDARAALAAAGGGRATLAALDARGAEVGALVSGEGTLVALGGGRIEASAIGAGAVGGRLELGSIELAGAARGVEVRDAELAVDGASVTGAEDGVLIEAGGPHALANLLVDGPSDRGVVVEGATATLMAVRVIGAGGHGVEVNAGAEATLQGCELRSNRGAGVAFYDAGGAVRGTTFGGTLPDGEGRADEIRAVAAEGTERSLEVAANGFDLDVARDCSGGGCTLVLGEGADLVGIVRPNCLVARPGTEAVFTVVDQAGASLSLLDDPTWSTLLAGVASDLGLAPGVAGTLPTPPVTISAPMALLESPASPR